MQKMKFDQNKDCNFCNQEEYKKIVERGEEEQLQNFQHQGRNENAFSGPP